MAKMVVYQSSDECFITSVKNIDKFEQLYFSSDSGRDIDDFDIEYFGGKNQFKVLCISSRLQSSTE